MLPTLSAGQQVLVCPGTPRRGDLVVFQFGYRERLGWPPIVKRCVAVAGDTVDHQRIDAGYYWVLADNPGTNYDSRLFGPIHESQIIGVVQWP